MARTLWQFFNNADRNAFRLQLCDLILWNSNPHKRCAILVMNLLRGEAKEHIPMVFGHFIYEGTGQRLARTDGFIQIISVIRQNPTM